MGLFKSHSIDRPEGPRSAAGPRPRSWLQPGHTQYTGTATTGHGSHTHQHHHYPTTIGAGRKLARSSHLHTIDADRIRRRFQQETMTHELDHHSTMLETPSKHSGRATDIALADTPVVSITGGGGNVNHDRHVRAQKANGPDRWTLEEPPGESEMTSSQVMTDSEVSEFDVASASEAEMELDDEPHKGGTAKD